MLLLRLKKNLDRFPQNNLVPFFHHHLQATAKLKQAEEAGSPSEKERLAREAVAQLLKVPQCVNLEQMVPRLAYLKQYEVRVLCNIAFCSRGSCYAQLVLHGTRYLP